MGARPFRRPPNTGFFAVQYTGNQLTAAFKGALASRSDDSTFLDGFDPNFGNSLVLPNRNLDFGYAKLDADGSYALTQPLHSLYATRQSAEPAAHRPHRLPGASIYFSRRAEDRIGGEYTTLWLSLSNGKHAAHHSSPRCGGPQPFNVGTPTAALLRLIRRREVVMTRIHGCRYLLPIAVAGLWLVPALASARKAPVPYANAGYSGCEDPPSRLRFRTSPSKLDNKELSITSIFRASPRVGPRWRC